jgi:phage tail protein X
MAAAPKRLNPHSWASDRELIALANTMDLEAITKWTGRKPDAIHGLSISATHQIADRQEVFAQGITIVFPTEAASFDHVQVSRAQFGQRFARSPIERRHGRPLSRKMRPCCFEAFHDCEAIFM